MHIAFKGNGTSEEMRKNSYPMGGKAVPVHDVLE